MTIKQKTSELSDWIKTLVPTVGRSLTWRLVGYLIGELESDQFRYVRHASLYPVDETSNSVEGLRDFVGVIVGRVHQVGGTKVAQKKSQE